MTTDSLGVYVHIPYCVRKCNYCDFCSRGIGNTPVDDRYIDSLISEIRSLKSDKRRKIDTVYVGGGTPSLLSPKQLENIIFALKFTFHFEKNVEFTLEANPGTVSFDKLSLFRSLGVNRLSFGVQSMNQTELSALGRIHSLKDVYDSYRAARDAGFDNVSFDLMYGIPGMTLRSHKDTLGSVLDLSPEHISLYGLILEEGTKFFDMKDKLNLPSLDEECDMYYEAAELLSKHGYSHYEISNYAKRGFESRHNLKYWTLREYVGFGASAASFYGGRRLVNTSNIDEYILSQGLKYEREENVSATDAAYEYVMLGLRLRDGISLCDYRERFGTDFLDGRRELIERLVSSGLAHLSFDRFALTERGFYVSNSILTEIL